MSGFLIRVYGMVQGVGFRPFIAELATELHIAGTVQNAGGIVHIKAFCDAADLDSFIERIYESAPKESHISRIQVEDLGDTRGDDSRDSSPISGMEEGRFSIVDSRDEKENLRFLPSDIGICKECAKELFDPKNRRYRYPFISCTKCGPRFTILEDIPYDRERITMGRFPMCPACKKEYVTAHNRRRHAQTIACHDCGPTLTSYEKSDRIDENQVALDRATSILSQGGVIALKNVGGFHLACKADSKEGINRLRQWKNREEKPFAVMYPNVEEVRKVCRINEVEEKLLEGYARPIVLLDLIDPSLYYDANGGSNRMGVMLPADPLQLLLTWALGPLLMTSGNRGGEPMHITGDAFLSSMKDEGFPDLVLDHNREILTPLDDSIYQVVEMENHSLETQILRRARGLVPEPIWLPCKVPEDTFLSGGDLKSVFGLCREDALYLSGHFGDLEWQECREKRANSIRHMERILDIHPKRGITDLHPLYLSRKEAEDSLRNVQGVQHHLAHTMAVAAEHGLHGQVLGISFDGTGYGTEESIWGSEFLWVEIPKDTGELTWTNWGHLSPVGQMGGDSGSRDGKRMLLAYLLESQETGLLTEEELDSQLSKYYDPGQMKLLKAAFRKGIGVHPSRSMGRLFDAASAALDICYENRYEGQCPMELEKYAFLALDKKVDQADFLESFHQLVHSAVIEKEDQTLEMDGKRILCQLLQLKKKGKYTKEELALYFHKCLIGLTIEMVKRRVDKHVPILLSGGSFLNRILLRGVVAGLEKEGYTPYFNHLVPPGDGGLALGQAYLACMKSIRKK